MNSLNYLPSEKKKIEKLKKRGVVATLGVAVVAKHPFGWQDHPCGVAELPQSTFGVVWPPPRHLGVLAGPPQKCFTDSGSRYLLASWDYIEWDKQVHHYFAQIDRSFFHRCNTLNYLRGLFASKWLLKEVKCHK